MKALWVILGALVTGAALGTSIVGLALTWAWMLGDPALDPEPVYMIAGIFGVFGVMGGGLLVGIGVDL